MPTTVTASNSIAYHLWQLHSMTTPEPEDTVEYLGIDNQLTDGHRASIQCGFDAGTRSWKVRFPTLAHGEIIEAALTGVNGETVSREEYVRALYAENKVSSKPFVYQWKGTYYFVDFVDPSLSMSRFRVKLYSSGLEMRQRRLAGVTLP